jgi:hypothetical protein
MSFHRKRVWSVADAKDAETLARDLRRTWVLCTGFRLGGYLFLNDSTSEDAIQEYAVVRERDLEQVESTSAPAVIADAGVTFGWCSPENALKYVQEAVAGKYDDCPIKLGRIDRRRIETPEQHHCELCA